MYIVHVSSMKFWHLEVVIEVEERGVEVVTRGKKIAGCIHFILTLVALVISFIYKSTIHVCLLVSLFPKRNGGTD